MQLFISFCGEEPTDERFFRNLTERIIENDDSGQFCQSIVLAIPIQETEAWMLCDKELLKDLMETTLNNKILELTYQISRIEDIASPKAKIENTLNVHKQNLPARKRRYAVNLSDLYEPFSQEVSFDNLENLNSFSKFRNDLKEVIENIIS